MRLVHRAIEDINAIVERLDFAEAHEAIGQVREHLEARAEQTRPLECPCVGACMNFCFGEKFTGCRELGLNSLDFEDLLGI
jgi:hypothetical protein